MKKIISVILSLSFTLLIFSCGSTKEVTWAAIQAEKDGVPTWVYEGRRDSKGIYATGAGKLSNLTNSLKMLMIQDVEWLKKIFLQPIYTH